MNRGKEGDNHASLTGRSKSDRLAYTQPEYSPTLSPPCDDRHAAFSIVLVGIQIADSVSTSRSRRYMVLSAQNIHFRLRLPCALRPADERVLGLIRLGR
jgi:hypothetical protein